MLKSSCSAIAIVIERFTSHLVQLPEGVESFTHISQNEFLERKHKKLKAKDIAICDCKYDASNPESACVKGCLNRVTRTECTPGYCHCDNQCRNQRFQRREYAKTKLFRTEGRGWGLLADENIKAGQFIIEYCGEVISSEKANIRSQDYDAHELKDAYIISLGENNFIDATCKGNAARFINHSCQPNCETRKWMVLGETRIGIFAKEDISAGTELVYDYNFEWHGGATVRCLCRAPNCSIFLGAKSRGFQEYNHVWEDGDDKYAVEDVPLYDSAEDEPLQGFSGTSGHNEHPLLVGSSSKLEPKAPSGSTPKKKSQRVPKRKGKSPRHKQVNDADYAKLFASKEACEEVSKYEEYNHVWEDGDDRYTVEEVPLYDSAEDEPPPVFSGTSGGNEHPLVEGSSSKLEPKAPSGSMPKKKSQHVPKQKGKSPKRKQVNDADFAKMFASKEARDEVSKYEGLKKEAASKLNSVYDEIRPVIEEHEGDNQYGVPTTVAEKWIEANCSKYKADFEFFFSVVNNGMCPPPASAEGPSEGPQSPQTANAEKGGAI